MKIQTDQKRRALKNKKNERGAVLITTLTVLVIMSMGISSILLITSQEYVLSRRSQNWNQVVYSAESGVEYGWNEMNKLTAINSNGVSSFMSGWISIGNSTWTNRLTLMNSYGNEGNSTVAVSVNTNYNNPAGSTLIQASGAMNSTLIATPVFRNVKVIIIAQTPFNYAILSKGSFNVNGNAANFDSWNSSNTGAYAPANQRAHANVGTDGLLLNLGGLTLRGSASSGPGGSNSGGTIVQPVSPDTGTNSFSTSTQVSIPDAGLPTNFSTTPMAGSTSMTTAGDYQIASIGSNNYTIGNTAPGQAGNYRIYVTGNIDLKGNDQFVIQQPSDYPTHVNTVQIYVAGSITFEGMSNTNTSTNDRAGQLQIYGLPTCSSVTISGNSQTQAAIYAPDAAVTMNGGGNQDFLGSLVGNTFTANGNIKFHYDETLANSGQVIGYKLTQWQEY